MAEARDSQLNYTFSRASRTIQENPPADSDLRLLSSLIANSAQPLPSSLKDLSRVWTAGDVFKSCCLRAVTSAANPFIPGITLSRTLSEAAKQAGEGERRTLFDIKSSIDELVLEIFERLPQTVRGFQEQAGVDACAQILEPGLMRASSDSNDLGGPLDMIVSEQQQLETYCKVPLVMDFMSNKFTLGLPDLVDTAGLLWEEYQLRFLHENGLVRPDAESMRRKATNQRTYLHDDEDMGFGQNLDSRMRRRIGYFSRFLPLFMVALLQGSSVVWLGWSFGPPTLTFLPGAQFIVANMVAAPAEYYKVPAVRMLLDFVAYVGMVAALSYFVLFHNTTGSVSGVDGIEEHMLSSAEGACALIFITVSTFKTYGGNYS